MNIKKQHIILIFILVFSAVLWTAKLNRLPLWEDEAHTALLAKSVIATGLPTVWDGRNLISGVQAEDFNKDKVMTWDQPLQFYATALSIKIFGLHNYSARLPFVIAGILSILLLYLFVERFTRDSNIALLTALIFSISVIFIIHARQCRYYSIGTFFVLLLYLSYIDFGFKKYAKITFPLALVGLFYSNLLMMATSVTSLIIYHFVSDFSWRRFKRFVLYSFFSLPFILPWFIYARLWEKQGPHAGANIATRLVNIFEMLAKFNRAFFPVIILLVVVYLLIRKKFFYDKKYYIFLLAAFVVALLLAPFLLLPAIRYAIYLSPLAAFLTALLTMEIYRKKKILAALFLFLMIFTKVFSNFIITVPEWCAALAGISASNFKGLPVKEEALVKMEKKIKNSTTAKGLADELVKMENIGYLHDITHEYKEPITGAVDFLKKNAKPGDEVMIMVDAFPLMLYAPEFHYAYIAEKTKDNEGNLKGMPEYVYSYENVKWFIPRTVKKTKGPFISETEFINWLGKNNKKYKKHEIDYLTFNWDGSRPESFSKYAIQHSNRPIKDEKVVIYEVMR